MKKVTRIIGAICMMGLLTFVTTSCKKNVENEEATISVIAPDFEEVGGERAYINQRKQFMWHEKDYIRVYNLADEANADESATSVFTKIGDNTAPRARFRGPSVGAKKPEGFRFFYPVEMVKGDAEEINQTLWNENRQIFQVSDHQQFHYYETPTHHMSIVDPAAMAMATRVEKLTDDATMQQMFGVASFNLYSDQYKPAVVVDSVLLEDKQWALTGEVSVKLHKVDTDVLNNLYNSFHGIDAAFLQDLATVLNGENGLGWMPANQDYKIMLNCMYEQDGELKGVTLAQENGYTYFNFLLRPLALSEGFNLTLYVHDGDPIELSDADFQYGIGEVGEVDYTWATKPKKIKNYVIGDVVNP